MMIGNSLISRMQGFNMKIQKILRNSLIKKPPKNVNYDIKFTCTNQ